MHALSTRVAAVCAVLLVFSVLCNAFTTYNYVYGVSPTGITNMDTIATLRILGGRVNDQLFLIHASSNCSHPPQYSSGKRTWTASLNSQSLATVAVSHLSSGLYTVCYRNAHRVNGTNVTNPTRFYHVSTFSALPYTVRVGGEVSADRSDFTCCGSFTAGEVGNCTIYLRDGNGDPTGSSNQSCRIAVCPLHDGGGLPIADYTAPEMVAFGVFVVSFLPTRSGCLGTAGVTFAGAQIANKQAFFAVKAGAAASEKSTSQCVVLANGTTACSITQRDFYDNPIRMCTYSSDGGAPVCNEIY